MSWAFNNPEFLWLLLGLPLLIVLRGKSGRNASVQYSSIAIANSVRSKNRSIGKGIIFFLRLLAIALLIVGLARPRLGKSYSESEESGIDIVLAVDVSYSMAALDLSKDKQNLRTRLDAVKEVIESFIKQRPSDRIGMVVFAANPFVVSPLTLNHQWLLDNISERVELGVIDGTQTAIGTAIATSVNRLKNLKNSKSRIIILLTDGDNNAGEISPILAAEAAASFDTKIYTIAAGREGLVSTAAIRQNGTVVRDSKGNPVPSSTSRSSVDEKSLKKISEITGGQFYKANNYGELQNIYKSIDKLEKSTVKIRNLTEYEEVFAYSVFAALALLLLERLLANTRFKTLP